MAYNLRLYVLAPFAESQRHITKIITNLTWIYLYQPLPLASFLPSYYRYPYHYFYRLKLFRGRSRCASCAFSITLTSRYIYRYAMRCYKRSAEALLRFFVSCFTVFEWSTFFRYRNDAEFHLPFLSGFVKYAQPIYLLLPQTSKNLKRHVSRHKVISRTIALLF